MERNESVSAGKNAKNHSITVVEMTKVALMTALLCVIAPHTIILPVSPVGITLGSFLVYLAGALLGPYLGSLSVLLYLLGGERLLVGIPALVKELCTSLVGGFERAAVVEAAAIPQNGAEVV